MTCPSGDHGLFCPSCGAKNDDDAMFCRQCGAKLNESAQPVARAQSSGPRTGAKGMVMRAFTDAFALVRDPVGYMTQNRDAAVSTRSVIVNYVAILAVITFIGTLIGDLITFSAKDHYVYAIPGAIFAYVLEIVGVVIIGIVIWKVGPSFATSTSQDTATRLAAYSYTPVLLASIFYAIPVAGTLLVFLALLYGLYILYRGIPVMLSTPKDRVVTYIIVIIVIMFVISIVLSLIAGEATSALR